MLPQILFPHIIVWPNGPRGPHRVMMNLDTWKSLSPEDQVAWDKMTEDGKGKIISCASKRVDKKPNGENPKQEVNVHDLVFDEDDKEDDTKW